MGFASRPLQSIDSLKDELSRTKGDNRILTLISLSEAYRNIHFADCIDYGMIAIDEARLLGDVSLEAKAYKSLGISAYYKGEFDKSISFYQSSMELYERIEDKAGVAACLNNIGIVFEEKADFESASEYYTKSFEQEKLMNNQEGMAISLISLGNINYHLNNLKEALDNYFQALLMFETLGNKSGEGYAYNSLGIVFLEWNNPEKAIKYFELALNVYEEIGDEVGLSKVLTNLGELYCDKFKNYKEALDYYNRSLSIKKKQEDNIGIALLYNNLGSLYARMEDFNKAYIYLQKSHKLYSEMESVTGLVMVDYNMGKMYQANERCTLAIEKYTSSLNMASKSAMNDYVLLNQKGLMLCNSRLSNAEEFNKYFSLYEMGRDSVIDNLRLTQMLEIESNYDIERILKRSEGLKEENREKEIVIRQLKLWMTALSGLIILIIFGYVLFLRVRKEK